MKRFFRRSLFQNLLSRVLPVLFVTSTVWFITILYFRSDTARSTEVRYLATSLEHYLHEARQAEFALMVDDLENDQFYESAAPTRNLKKHSVALLNARANLTTILENVSESDRDSFTYLTALLDKYETTFASLVETYRKRGFGKWGLEGELASAASELDDAAKTANPEIKNALLLLNFEKSSYLLNREHMRSSHIENIGNDLARLRALFKASGRSDSLRALDDFRTRFMRYTLLQSEIGLAETSGIRKSLKETVEEIEMILSAVRSDMNDRTQESFRQFLKFSILILISGMIWEYFAVRAVTLKVSAPLKALTLAALEIKKGNLTTRFAVDSKDEVGFLASVFNEMIDHLTQRTQESEKNAHEARKLSDELLGTQQQLLQAQKLEAVGTLAGGIAHDFNNLLGAILNYAGILKGRLADDLIAQRDIEIIEKTAERGAELTGKLLGFARKGRYQESVFDVNKTIQETKELLFRTIDSRITLLHDFAPDIWSVTGDANQILQVLVNLGINARDAMPNGGELFFSTENLVIDETQRQKFNVAAGRYVRIVVRDTGTGIPAEQQGKIFDPFFTTKAVGKGTGLGLAMAYGIVSRHGGAIRLESSSNEGTSFEILLPSAGAPALSSTQTAPNGKIDPSRLNGKFILLADDEAVFQQALKEILESYGATVFSVSNGREAIEFCKSNHPLLNAVIMDVIMPHMGGLEASEEILKFAPDLRIILCSGYAEDSAITDFREHRKRVGFLQKPFKQDLLLAQIENL